MPRIWVPSDTTEKRKMLQDLFSNPNLLPPSLLSYLNDYNALNQAQVPASQIMGISGFLERLDTNAGTVTIASSTALTTIYSYDVPAGTLQTKGGIGVDIASKWLQQSGVNSTLRLVVKYGATTMVDITADAVGTSADVFAAPMRLILCNKGASNSQEVLGSLMLVRSSNAAGYGWVGFSVDSKTGAFGGSATEDSTTKLTFSVAIQLSVNHASNVFTKIFAVTHRASH